MNEKIYIISNPGQTFTLRFGRDRNEKIFGLLGFRTNGASD